MQDADAPQSGAPAAPASNSPSAVSQEPRRRRSSLSVLQDAAQREHQATVASRRHSSAVKRSSLAVVAVNEESRAKEAAAARPLSLSALEVSLDDSTVSPEPATSGYLIKQGRLWRSWKKRFFILDGLNLRYFVGGMNYRRSPDAPTDSRPFEVPDGRGGWTRGVTPKGATITVTGWGWVQAGRGRRSARLLTRGVPRQLLLGGDESELQRWAEALQAALVGGGGGDAGQAQGRQALGAAGGGGREGGGGSSRGGGGGARGGGGGGGGGRSEEHTSELQSQSTISYAVFCLKKKIPLATCVSRVDVQSTQKYCK